MKAKSLPQMTVQIGRLQLKNPVMTASGTFGYGQEYADYVDLNSLGAIVVKGLSLLPRPGNPPPRIMETAGGMLNAIGLQNIGVDTFIEEKLPYLRQHDVAVIANIYGESYAEYQKVAKKLSAAKGVHALEVNVSCPNVQKGGLAFGTDPKVAARVTRKVKQETDLPVIIKLTPNVTDIAAIAEAVEEAGADAVSLINTLTGMSVNLKDGTPHLKNITGGLSGPAIKPVALRMVWQVVKRVSIPVIGIGGILNAGDALEFLMVGAKAVQVGTANFINPRATTQILAGLQNYLQNNKINDINKVIGTFKEGGSSC
ncbi:MAG: dihydroorotate dehydrogenase [Deltaproteobacteria bacterium HGW-Deltaproteobacteria-12]|jgi:dihydroorotate dehydrogenase (NAD+) catalytic subunit|nr:MAG: dihydroorotate dehydrogenase [Deltaproteobacteria bacterium HGW-Deltaproteobacteria-12]